MNSRRLYFIDNLRWFVIIIVVFVHTTVTYSHIGGWYYYENQVDSLDVLSKLVSVIFNTFSQAYFMGFLFLLAGYFVPLSYDKKGIAKFIKDRLVRLGAPLIFYIFIIDPFINFVLLERYLSNSPYSFTQFYSHYLKSLNFLGGTGPLWFAEALLIFSIFYALFRFVKNNVIKSYAPDYLPSNKTITLLILLVSIFVFIIRLFYPINTAFYNLQLCFFTQYIVMFILGILCYRTNLLLRLPYKFGMKWLKISLFGGFLLWVLMLALGGGLSGNDKAYYGGFYWQAAAYGFWESVFCAGVSLGLIVFFRDKLNFRNRLTGFLSDNYFGVYVFHAPILIFISITLRHIYIYPLLKILIVGTLAIISSFLFSYIIKKLPFFKTIFS